MRRGACHLLGPTGIVASELGPLTSAARIVSLERWRRHGARPMVLETGRVFSRCIRSLPQRSRRDGGIEAVSNISFYGWQW